MTQRFDGVRRRTSSRESLAALKVTQRRVNSHYNISASRRPIRQTGVRELNVFFDVRADKTFTLNIPPPPLGTDFGKVSDVILALECEADLV